MVGRMCRRPRLWPGSVGPAAAKGGATRIEATMRDGVINGPFTMTLPSGATVSGNGADGDLEGDVVINAPAKGLHYEGQSLHGIPEGHGTATWSSGRRYEGEWHEGKQSGTGTLRFAGKGHPTYEGEFRDGQQNGHGTMSFDSGNAIEGEWKDGFLERGSYTTPDGDHFEGEFHGDKKNGTGIMVSRDGTRYEGQWKDNLPDGQGTLTQPGAPPFAGEWKQGCFQDRPRPTSFRVDPTACDKSDNVPNRNLRRPRNHAKSEIASAERACVAI
jgi:hypothetical protein